jgi:hypothetical protein
LVTIGPVASPGAPPPSPGVVDAAVVVVVAVAPTLAEAEPWATTVTV